MRITGGANRGRKIVCPPGTIRPAMDRMRESLFSMLGPIEGLSFLDLFSGSGSMGLEAESRGAQPVVLVEKDRRKRPVIMENLKSLSSSARLVLMPVERFVVSATGTFDLIFLDPPFAYKHKKDLLQKASDSRLIGPETRLLIHFPTQEELPERVGRLTLQKARNYGGSRLHIYEPDAGDTDATSPGD